MDGTLLDSMGIWEEVGEIYLNRRGIEAKPGLNDAIINMRLIDGARLLIDDYGLSSSAEEICARLQEYYQHAYFVNVLPFGSVSGTIYANTLAGTNRLEIIVCGHEEQTSITARFDNLGKGASGAAVQNMNIMLGIDERCGLE